MNKTTRRVNISSRKITQREAPLFESVTSTCATLRGHLSNSWALVSNVIRF